MTTRQKYIAIGTVLFAFWILGVMFALGGKYKHLIGGYVFDSWTGNVYSMEGTLVRPAKPIPPTQSPSSWTPWETERKKWGGNSRLLNLEEKTEPTVKVRLPDKNLILSFPAGMSEEDMADAIMKNYYPELLSEDKK
jgi:hypothetical protein